MPWHPLFVHAVNSVQRLKNLSADFSAALFHARPLRRCSSTTRLFWRSARSLHHTTSIFAGVHPSAWPMPPRTPAMPDALLGTGAGRACGWGRSPESRSWLDHPLRCPRLQAGRVALPAGSARHSPGCGWFLATPPWSRFSPSGRPPLVLSAPATFFVLPWGAACPQGEHVA